MSTLTLTNLPVDVLYHILSFLNLADNVAFCLVCCSLSALSLRRSMWIQALKNERRVRPIACTSYEDLSKLDLPNLKRIVLHTMRLERNWSAPEPQITGAIKAVVLSTQVRTLDLIFQVPATQLFVFHSRATGELLTWDAALGKQVLPPLYISKRVMDVSPGQEAEGKFAMGLLTSENPFMYLDNKIIVVCLEYGPAGVHLQVTFTHKLTTGLSHWAIFMTKEYVGVLECAPSFQDADDEEYVHVAAFNLATQRCTTIKTDMAGRDFANAHSGTSSIHGDVYILIEDKGKARSVHIPKSYLPHNDNPDCPPSSSLQWRDHASEFDISPADPEHEYIPEGALSANDFYQVPAVSLHAVRSFPDNPIVAPPILKMQIRFWGASDSMTAPRLQLRAVIDIQGKLQDSPDSSWKLMLLSHSGKSILLVIDDMGMLQLQLIRFDPETKVCTPHNLMMPFFIPLAYVYGLSIDDHLGVITLLDTRGVLFSIPYA